NLGENRLATLLKIGSYRGKFFSHELTVLYCWLATRRPVCVRGLLAHGCVTQAGVLHIGCQRENRTRQEPLGVRPCIWALRSETSGSLGHIFNDSLALSSTLLWYNTPYARERKLQRQQNPDRKAGLSIYIIQTGLPKCCPYIIG